MTIQKGRPSARKIGWGTLFSVSKHDDLLEKGNRFRVRPLFSATKHNFSLKFIVLRRALFSVLKQSDL